MSELEEFRQSVRTWLEENAPESLKGKMGDPIAGFWAGKKTPAPFPDSKAWLDMMAEKGWTVPFWPKEYGGGGLSRKENKVLIEELGRLKLPSPLVGFGITMIGPTLLQYGTEEQKQFFLPKICSGEIRWCQGYSEPNAGSDLANVQAQLTDDGDEYTISGQKVWTSYGDMADWIFMIGRTDWDVKKQAGITFILVDMDQPGVDVRPIKLISGDSPFCEVFFDNVKASKKHVLGEVNKGWEVAKALLGHERTMIADAFGSSRPPAAKALTLDGAAKQYIGMKDGQIADPSIRDRLSQIQMDEACFNLTVQRNVDNMKAGHNPGPESSMFKVYGTELNQRRQELFLSIMGPESLGWVGDGFTKDELTLTRTWLRSRGNTIEGGTSEIQLNIIAKMVLGLPDK
jgi:alkylation response protein AidB-like acyl-CoA dehydrogenase